MFEECSTTDLLSIAGVVGFYFCSLYYIVAKFIADNKRHYDDDYEHD